MWAFEDLTARLPYVARQVPTLTCFSHQMCFMIFSTFVLGAGVPSVVFKQFQGEPTKRVSRDPDDLCPTDQAGQKDPR